MLATAVLSLLAIWSVARAGAADRPCAADVARHCRLVKPGGGRLLRCLDAHRDELSPACRAANDARLAARTRRHPCADDRERLCAGLPPDGRVFACLRSRVEDLSPSCRRVVGARAGAPAR